VLLGRPVLLWLLFWAVVSALALIAKAIAPQVLPGPAGVGALQVGLQLLMLLLVLPFAARTGLHRLGLLPPHTARSLQVLAFPTITVALGFVPGLRETPLETLLLGLASAVLAGVMEEVAFRGVLLNALLPRGAWPAVAISSMLFGLMHASNALLGAPWQTVLLQIVFAGMAGTGYAAMRLRTGSLWPPVVLHALFDLTFRVAAIEPGSPFVNGLHLLHGVGWLVFALIVLRRSSIGAPASTNRLA
jgi:membrane protease YdiL (CAAX protease family)